MTNAQRRKSGILPWESKFRKEDPDNQRVNVPDIKNINDQQSQRNKQKVKMVKSQQVQINHIILPNEVR